MEQPPLLQILEIFRSRKINSTFFILTKRDLYKVNQEMYVRILQGYVYKYDTIRILKEDREAGIIFEVVGADEEVDDRDFEYDYLDYIYHKYTLLPFLSDTLPCQTKEIDQIPDGAKPVMSGKIVYKTRINNTLNSQYLFFILDVGSSLVKAIIWKENLKYSSLEVGESVHITKLRPAKGYTPQGHIENNEFSEMTFFNIKEITVSELFKGKNIESNEKKLEIDVFYEVSGFIKYRSVLNRRNHHTYVEYYLLTVGNKKVMLFYNSDLSFYNIEAGNKIEITNLRKLIRKGETFYISTVFTQFKYENIAEHNELCSTFLHEIPNKRKMEDSSEESCKDKKRRQIESNVMDLSITCPASTCESQKLEINDRDLLHILDNTTIVSKNPEIEEDDSIICDVTFIESAYGFLPDSIFQEDEEYITINGGKYTITPFFAPKKIKLEELEDNCHKLVINESEKFLLEGKILEVEDPSENSDYCISYIDTNVIKNQYPLTVHIENCIPVHIFDNFFARDKSELRSKIYDFIGRDCNIILHVFRASVDHVIYSISDIERK